MSPVPPDLFMRLCKLSDDPFSYLFKTRSGNKYNSRAFVRLIERLRDDMRRAMGMHEEAVDYVTPSGQHRTKNALTRPDPLADDFVPYCLRHTYCTDLKDAGVDIRDAQYLMGHSDITMTANIYTHGSKDTALKVADIFEKTAPLVAAGGNTSGKP